MKRSHPFATNGGLRATRKKQVLEVVPTVQVEQPPVFRRPRIDRKRQPLELLSRISATIIGICSGEDITYQYDDDAWIRAAFTAFEDVADLLEELPEYKAQFNQP